MAFDKNGLTDQEKEMVIAQALETDEGRTALAQAMVEPIRRSLEYQAIGRKLLMVDELPQGALARYERDVAAIAWVVSRRGAVPDQIQEGEEVLVPTFEIAANPTVRLSEIKARRFYIVDRAQIKAKDSLQRQEDKEVFNVISAAVPSAHTVTVSGNLSPDHINLALALIEEHELVGAKIVCHPFRYKDVRAWGKDFYDEATQRDVIMSGLFGHIWTADIHVSTMVPNNTVYVLAPGEFVGAFPVRQDITVLPSDDSRQLKLGWVIYEEVGMAVINDYATAQIRIVNN
jgi:hypothetical protein